MRLQGAMRGSHAPTRWGVAEARHGAAPEAWSRPTGDAAPDRPGRRGPPVAPAIRHERGEEGPRPGRPEGMATVPASTLCDALGPAWGAAQSGWGKESHTPPPAFRRRLPG